MTTLTYVQNGPGITLGLTGYGLLRAAIGDDYLTLEVGNCLVNALDGLSGIPSSSSFELSLHQLQNPVSSTRRAGLKGVVQIFASTPSVREELINRIRSSPFLAKHINAWKDFVWMRAVDGIMGFGESSTTVPSSYFEIARERMPSWTIDLYKKWAIGNEISSHLGEADRLTLLKMLNRDVIRDDMQWKKVLPLLWKYWSANYFPSSCIAQRSLSAQILGIIVLLRAQRRFAASIGVEPKTVELFQERIKDLLYDADGKAQIGLMYSDYSILWKNIHKATLVQDPVMPLANSDCGEFLCSKLEEWINKAISPEGRRGYNQRDLVLMHYLELGRKLAIAADATDEFAEILIRPGGSLLDCIKALKNFVGKDEGETKTLYSKPNQVRLVTWNPYAVESDIVLHGSLGEGRVIGQPDSRGMVKIDLIGLHDVVTVPSSKITSALDRDEYIRALRFRTEKFSKKAPFFASRAMLNAFSKIDPAKKLVDDMFSCNDESSYIIPINGVIDYLMGKRVRLYGSNPIKRMTSQLFEVGKILGFDPIAWSWRLASGKLPAEVLSSSIGKSSRLVLSKRITPDLIRGFVWFRPWQQEWQGQEVGELPNMRTAGYYYPTYYRGTKQDDLTDLYFNYRDGDQAALIEAAMLMQPLVEKWGDDPSRKEEVLLIPMIGTAPNEELTELLDYPSLFPWKPRPPNYGEGVEGRTLAQKMEILEQSLSLDLSKSDEIAGKSVLIIDDNVTDHATWMTARRLLFDAGAAEVGMVALTETIRRPEDFDWVLR